MNWEPQHLPWKVPEPQIDGPASPDIPPPRVLDASLALPKSGFNLPLPPWQNVRRSDGILELRVPGKRPDHNNEWKHRPDIDDEPLGDDDWKCEAIENFGEMPLVYNNPKLSNDMLLDAGGYGHLGSNELELIVGKDNLRRIRRINAWEREHIKPFDLKELNSEDYSKLFKVYKKYNKFGYLEDGSSDINLSQILLNPPTTEKQWLELKKVEYALGKLMHETWVAGKNPYEHAPNSPYGLEQDLFLRYRNQISKETGLNYRAVSTALNRILRKTIKRRETIDRAFLSDDVLRIRHGEMPDWRHVWNRTNEWRMDLDDITKAREKYGTYEEGQESKTLLPNWLKRYAFVWRVQGLGGEGYCVAAWPHTKQYVNEFGLI